MRISVLNISPLCLSLHSSPLLLLWCSLLDQKVWLTLSTEARECSPCPHQPAGGTSGFSSGYPVPHPLSNSRSSLMPLFSRAISCLTVAGGTHLRRLKALIESWMQEFTYSFVEEVGTLVDALVSLNAPFPPRVPFPAHPTRPSPFLFCPPPPLSSKQSPRTSCALALFGRPFCSRNCWV